MKQRRTAQKIALAIAIICYIAAVVCVSAVVYWGNQLGAGHPVTGSLAASVVFLISVGVVLQVMGSVSLPDLRIAKSHTGSKGDL